MHPILGAECTTSDPGAGEVKQGHSSPHPFFKNAQLILKKQVVITYYSFSY